MQVSVTRQMSEELRQVIAQAGATSYQLLSSNLPPTLSFELLLPYGQGRLSGQVPPRAATYQLMYSLYNQAQCEVIRLTVVITVGEPTAPTGGLQVTITEAVAEQVCGDEYSHLVLVSWQASGGTPPLSVGPIALRLPDGSFQLKLGNFPTSGSVTFQVNAPSGGTATAQVRVQDAQGRTQTAQREVELPACQVGILPPIRVYPLQVQLDVRAHRLIHVTPGYEELELPVRLSDEEEERYTPFTVQRAQGTQITLWVPARSGVAGAYGVGFRHFEVWEGDAQEPVIYEGVYNRRTGTYSLTLTLNRNTRVIAIYQDIIG
jgi:hypothetical protein